jgi:hypothetical protein
VRWLSRRPVAAPHQSDPSRQRGAGEWDSSAEGVSGLRSSGVGSAACGKGSWQRLDGSSIRLKRRLRQGTSASLARQAHPRSNRPQCTRLHGARPRADTTTNAAGTRGTNRAAIPDGDAGNGYSSRSWTAGAAPAQACGQGRQPVVCVALPQGGARDLERFIGCSSRLVGCRGWLQASSCRQWRRPRASAETAGSGSGHVNTP